MRTEEIILNRENTLRRAGFKPYVAKTRMEQQKLDLLSNGKVTRVKYNGKVSYLYAGPDHHRILVGNTLQYMLYQKYLMDQVVRKGEDEDLLDKAWVETGMWDDVSGWRSVGWN